MSDTVSNQHNYLKGFLFALIAVILWSGNFIVARALHQKIPPVSLAFFRWLCASLILLPIAVKSFIVEWKQLLPHWKYLCLTALVGVTIFNTLVYVAGKYSSATNMALIGTTAAPVFVLIISVVFLRQTISMLQIIGAALCIAGILILISKGNLNNLKNFHFSIGDAWILLAALSFAIYTVLVRRKPQNVSSLSFLLAVFLIGTIFIFPAYLIEQSSGKTFEWDSTIFYVVLYLGIGASVLGFLLWNASIKNIGPARTALFGNLIPVFSSIEAALMLGEKFTSITAISLIVIFSGIVIANLHVLRRST